MNAFRKAGATARAMPVAAAADACKVDPASLRTQNGYVIDKANGRRLTYGISRLTFQMNAAHYPT